MAIPGAGDAEEAGDRFLAECNGAESASGRHKWETTRRSSVSGKPGASTSQPWDFLRWVHEKSHSQFNDRKKTNGWRASGDGRTVLSQWSDSACVLPERRGGQVDAGLVAAQEQGTPQKEARGVSGSGAGVGGHGDNFELGDGNPQPGGMDDSLTADAERG